jgi:hypothetical protein
VKLWSWWNIVLWGSGHKDLERMRNSWCWADWGCEIAVQRFGTASLSSQCEIRLWEILAACQFCPLLSPVYKWNQNTEIKLLLLWLASYVTFSLPGELYLLHTIFTVCCVGQIPSSSESNLRRVIKTLEMKKFVFILWHYLKMRNAEINA